MAEDDDDALNDRKPTSGGMDDTSFASAVGSLVGDALDYMAHDVAPDQEEATKYFRGEPLGDEEEGRSQIVMTEVRDTVQAMMPALLRIFAGSEKVVEFAPATEQDVPGAEQATDYVNHVFYNDNPGFSILYNGCMDALVRKIGVLTWYVEEEEFVEELDFSDLTADEVAILTADDDIELISEEEQPDRAPPGPAPAVPMPGAPPLAVPPAPEALFTIRVRRTGTKRHIRAAAVPPEEFFISRDALDEDDAKAIGRRRDRTVSDLVAMGFDEDDIRANMGADDAAGADNGLKQARNPGNDGREDTADPALDEVAYFEAYVLVDRDGDGIAERRRVRGINPKNPYVLDDELWADAVPFGLLCPTPEPHTAIGYSIADQVADLQEIKTSVVRNTLDSLANAIHPRTVIVEGQVNVDDALNTEVGAIIRARAPGMVQELEKPFVGQYSLPLIAYLDETASKRTGITAASQGLDADVLQSTTKAAVTATVSAAQERIEMVARIFAETGLRRLMRGLLKLSVRYSDKARMVRLRNKWVPVDPRVWDADMDVIVNIGLGRGSDQDRLQLYMMVAQKQEQIIAAAGPTNPLANMKHLRATYAKIMEIGGERDVTKFFAEIDESAIAAAANTNKPPDPAAMLAQIEMQKVQLRAAAEQAKDAREREKMKLEDDRERDRMAMEFELKRAEIEAKMGAQIREAELRAEIERDRATNDRWMRADQAERDRAHQSREAQAGRVHEVVSGAADREHQAVQAGHDRTQSAQDAEAARRHAAEQANADREAAAARPKEAA